MTALACCNANRDALGNLPIGPCGPRCESRRRPDGGPPSVEIPRLTAIPSPPGDPTIERSWSATSTGPHVLTALWDALEARNAVVARLPLLLLAPATIDALVASETYRLEVLCEEARPAPPAPPTRNDLDELIDLVRLVVADTEQLQIAIAS